MMSLKGFYEERNAKPGPVSGSGPSYYRAMAAYWERRRQLGLTGTWRAVDAAWAKNNGYTIDPDWTIL